LFYFGQGNNLYIYETKGKRKVGEKPVIKRFKGVLVFVDKNRLMGKGLGYIDIHLLASAILTSIPLWTKDKILARTAKDMGAGYNFP
jgi:hypothetical protein